MEAAPKRKIFVIDNFLGYIYTLAELQTLGRPSKFGTKRYNRIRGAAIAPNTNSGNLLCHRRGTLSENRKLSSAAVHSMPHHNTAAV